MLRIHELDPRFKDDLAREPGCQHLLRCFSCGVCTATCPVSEIEPEFSPSLIIRRILYGMKKELLASPALWYCARCANCSFQCPQDVRFMDIVRGLRTMAVREEFVSPEHAARLEEAERLVQELRRRLIRAILEKTDGDLDPKDALSKLLQESEKT
ncbi:MAG: 4Fe-4S dicluster domain-containing protein [Deltaproteobacteria bacterium]|nr:4Fe-4S dicluster domain-containing protein [Deltaproteobacteria bacterium]